MAGRSEGPSESGIPFAVERVNDLPRLASCGASLNYRWEPGGTAPPDHLLAGRTCTSQHAHGGVV